MIATAAATLLTGCANATRFDDPLANPFQARADYDRAPTGAIRRQEAAAKTTRNDASPAKPAVSNWSAEGGTNVTVGQGEGAGVLATRYGVPTDALLRANGLSSASQVQPGTKIIIPVYRAGAARATSAAPAQNHAKSESAAPVQTKTQSAKKTEPAKPKTIVAAAGKGASVKIDHAPTASVSAPKVDPVKQKLAEEDKARQREKAKQAKLLKEQEAKKAAALKQARLKEAKKQEAEKLRLAEAKRKEKPVAQVQAKVETPKVEAKKQIDPTPTASVPPVEERRSLVDASNPEFRWPARGRVIQGFKAGSNDGINIAVPEGTPVKAAENGVVAYSGSELKGYGNLVLIRHPNGYVSAYAHNESLDVRKGEQVKRGQVIAKAGQTGNVSSPQIHFELRKGSSPVDPIEYLAGL